ncbi:hypothetical protein BJ138DRAFT_1106467 [Hygrophoropsis aurantiaca]|uniref:Uncharacterized protein n=1 Tax=Hygrophoropsis aurantiaca TaxID=72124 RepID=A0ACB7ZVQ0_9AGAM|nr:hypothetical protein BJ138DRAFT_1106467 [Hygrophoropsis aurantiaca]
MQISKVFRVRNLWHSFAVSKSKRKRVTVRDLPIEFAHISALSNNWTCQPIPGSGDLYHRSPRFDYHESRPVKPLTLHQSPNSLVLRFEVSNRARKTSRDYRSVSSKGRGDRDVNKNLNINGGRSTRSQIPTRITSASSNCDFYYLLKITVAKHLTSRKGARIYKRRSKSAGQSKVDRTRQSFFTYGTYLIRTGFMINYRTISKQNERGQIDEMSKSLADRYPG